MVTVTMYEMFFVCVINLSVILYFDREGVLRAGC